MGRVVSPTPTPLSSGQVVPALVASYDMHGRAVGLFYTQPTGQGGQYIVHKFTMVVGESFQVLKRLVYSVSARLSSGPLGSRPHARLKAGTPGEAPTPAPTTKIPSPQQRIGAV